MKKQDIIKILEKNYIDQKENYDETIKQNNNTFRYYWGGMIAIISLYSELSNYSITFDEAETKLEKAYQKHLQNKEAKNE